MRKTTLLFSAFLICALMLLSGCDAFKFNSAENLIRPPKLSGSNGELQSAFEKAVSDKGEYILKYPTGGDYRSAFVRFDCDNDGNDEAFVFYSPKSEEMSVYMYILDYSNGKWNPVETFPGEGSDIYSIEFCDLNNDADYEILVGWNTIDSKSNKKLSVYGFKKTDGIFNFKLLAIEAYTAMLTVDIDGDLSEEILIALINSTSDDYTTEAKLLKMSGTGGSEPKIETTGRVSLYSEITAFLSVNSGKSDGRTYIYIDEIAGDSYLTELLYWDKNKNTLIAPLDIDVLSVSSCPTSRSVPLTCEDIDSDGELEIPSTMLLKNSSIVRESTANQDLRSHMDNIYVISWSKYANGDFAPVKSYIENTESKYRYTYDSEKMANWSVVFYPDTRVSQFFLNNVTEDEQAENEPVLLFTVRAVDKSETVSSNSYLFTGFEFKYVYEITAEGEEAGITKSDIASALILKEN